MTPAEVLEEAAAVIERNGWLRGSFFDAYQLDSGAELDPKKCRVCALGAIKVATGRAPYYPLSDEGGEAAEYFARHLGKDPSKDPNLAGVIQAVSEWNDAPGMTAELVIETLRACAAEQEGA